MNTTISHKEKQKEISDFINTNYSEFEDQAKKCLSSQFKKKLDITKREYLHLDLLHDVIINLLDATEEKTDRLYSLLASGDLRVYVLGIIYRNASWEKSAFREAEKKYKVVEFPEAEKTVEETEDTHHKVEIDKREQEAAQTILNLLETDRIIEWHYIKLFKEYYLNNVTLQSLADKYKISINTIYSMIMKTKSLVVYLLKENGLNKLEGRKG